MSVYIICLLGISKHIECGLKSMRSTYFLLYVDKFNIENASTTNVREYALLPFRLPLGL